MEKNVSRMTTSIRESNSARVSDAGGPDLGFIDSDSRLLKV